MRLTNAIRDRAEAAILRKQGFFDKIEAAEKAIPEHLKREWEKSYPNGIEAFKDWISTRSHFRVENLNGYHLESFPLGGYVFAKQGNTPECKVTPEITAMIETRDRAKAEMEEARATIRAVLNSCSTTKQIHEVAPELDKYMPDEGDTPSTGLVDMATVQKLRAMLG